MDRKPSDFTPFQTAYTASSFVECRCEIIEGPSLTVPDLSLSIKDIFEKHTRGVPLSEFERMHFYDDENDEDFGEVSPTDLADFDLVDVAPLKASLRERISASKVPLEQSTPVDSSRGLSPSVESLVTPKESE